MDAACALVDRWLPVVLVLVACFGLVFCVFFGLIMRTVLRTHKDIRESWEKDWGDK